MRDQTTNPEWLSQGRRALIFIRPFRGVVFVILGLTLGGAALSAVEPLVLKYLFDELGGGGTFQTVGLAVGGLLALGLGHEAILALSSWLTWRVRLGVHYGLLEATVDRLHSLPLAFHKEESVGGIMTKLDRGIQGFLQALSEIAFNVLPALVYLALSFVLMLRLDGRLSWVVLAFTPLPALIGAWAAEPQTRRERTLLDRWAKIYSRFNEVLSGIMTVKSFAMEDEEKRRFLSGVREANAVVARGVGFDSGVGAAKNGIVMLARIAAIAFGGVLILRGEMTLGTLVAFLGYVGGLFGPVQGLTGIYQTLRRASVSLQTIYAILDAQDRLADPPNAREVESLRGEVLFSGVGFAYNEKKPIVRRIDLYVRPGEMVALVGPSGAGKTTLMALLQRLYDPTAGAILVDGADLRTLKQRSLRRQIGVVLQEALLFNDSVRNNIAYGKPGASQREIIEAAQAAYAHEFIARLPEGYETLVGERGGRFSAGERQRIAIARALLKNPPILILDEATSALDAESEALVQEALARLVKGRTTFVIAHRLSTVVGADRILVLKEGEIIESGDHEALMKADGYYASLVRRQTQGLLASASSTPLASLNDPI
ncbi:MAG: ABC transporter ATP-binding protein/permease [Candidatus Manganitrophus sp. SB1]|nr:ABC transporter ATP-binding protein/permease [Candidatus Manganitrophus morganii]